VRCIEEQIKCTTNLLGHKVISIDNKMIIIEDNMFANEAVQVVTEFNDVKEALLGATTAEQLEEVLNSHLAG